MILKVIGQFLIATTIMQMMPADASMLEFQVGVSSDLESAQLDMSEISNIFVPLPRADDRFNYPVKVNMNSYGVVTTAQSAIVIDRDSGMVLFQKHPDSIRSIGSVTKLMTALIFLEQHPDLSQIVTLNPDVDYISGGRVYLGYYDELELRDVLAASLIGSDNTATKSLVRFSGLSSEEYISLMNQKAKELGMRSTFFTDPTGIQDSNMSSARDLVTLLKTAEVNNIIKYYTELPSIKIEQGSGRMTEIHNTNGLLTSFLNEGKYDIIGGKTGYLPQAGYVLATTVGENNHAVHIIVLGSSSKDDRVNDAKGLAVWAFKTFNWE